MTWTVDDFGKFEAFVWQDERLTAHGYPPEMGTLQERLQKLQLDRGWTGTQLGGGADGLQGPRTLAFLYSDPVTPLPSNVVELSKFKRTLPTGKPGKPTEVYDMEDAVVPVSFRAPVDGVTTKGTVYARDELREMDGEDGAAWSNVGERHVMAGSCRVLEIPGMTGKYVTGTVFAQMHDDSDDVVILLVNAHGEVVLEEGLGKGNGSDKTVLFDGYRLGDVLDFVIDAHDGVIDVTVNGHHEQIDKAVEDAYWKAGCYLRGNASNATGAGRVDYDALEERHAA